MSLSDEPKKPKKRGRKPKPKPIDEKTKVKKSNGKKRGRKPKGGKIIETTSLINKTIQTMPNIILHLQCNIDDVKTTFNLNDTYDPNVILVENYNNEDDNYFKTNYTLITPSTDDKEELEVDNILMSASKGRAGQILSSGFFIIIFLPSSPVQ